MMRFVVGLLLAAMMVTNALAAETFRANLRPRPGVVSNGSGSAVLVLNDAGTFIEYDIRMTGLTSPEIGAHIHRPDRSRAFVLPLGDIKVGVWTPISQLDLIDLRAGRLFVLIHTQDNAVGELRGDLSTTVVQTESVSWSELRALFR